MVKEEVQEPLGFFVLKAYDTPGETLVDEKRFLASDRMLHPLITLNVTGDEKLLTTRTTGCYQFARMSDAAN